MRIAKSTFLLLFFVCYWSWAQAPLNPQEEETFINNVEAFSQETKTLKGNFIQTKELSFVEKSIKSNGDFYYKSPNLVKWEYKTPYLYSVIFKDGELLINDDGKKQQIDLSSNKLFEKLSDLIANSINGKMLLDEGFSTHFVKQNGIVLAKMIPKEKELSDFFKAIELYFNIKNYLVEKVKLIEKSGDFTSIEFTNLKHNPSLDASVFTH